MLTSINLAAKMEEQMNTCSYIWQAAQSLIHFQNDI